jgi:hypothetical protein
MRRYGVRILVAVLTFLLGVAFSFGLGLFRANETRHKERSRWKRDCPKSFVQKEYSTPFTVYNHETAPLRLTFLGPTFDTRGHREQMLQVLVENISRQTVTGYSIGGERSWKQADARPIAETKFGLLSPGQSGMAYVSSSNEGRAELWLSRVDFQDGSTWNNPRGLR